MDHAAYIRALTMTLLVEMPIVLGAWPASSSWVRILVIGLVANLMTHRILWWVFPYVPLPYAVAVGLAEVLVTAAEGALFARFGDLSWRDAMVLSLVANATSTVVGLMTYVGTT